MSCPRPRSSVPSPRYPRWALAGVLVVGACSRIVPSSGKPDPGFSASPSDSTSAAVPRPQNATAGIPATSFHQLPSAQPEQLGPDAGRVEAPRDIPMPGKISMPFESAGGQANDGPRH